VSFTCHSQQSEVKFCSVLNLLGCCTGFYAIVGVYKYFAKKIKMKVKKKKNLGGEE
jgi:hypothetical protein